MERGLYSHSYLLLLLCGAVSGFHALIASGTTPKLIANGKWMRVLSVMVQC